MNQNEDYFILTNNVYNLINYLIRSPKIFIASLLIKLY